MLLPAEARPLLAAFLPHLTQPTYTRFVTRTAAATGRRRKLAVAWYGGGTRRVEAVTGTGHRYKGGNGLVPIRWVFATDTTGTHRDEYLFTTDRYHARPEATRVGSVAWAGKETVTFPDARTAARRWIWAAGAFPQARIDGAIAELPENVREVLLSGLAPAP